MTLKHKYQLASASEGLVPKIDWRSQLVSVVLAFRASLRALELSRRGSQLRRRRLEPEGRLEFRNGEGIPWGCLT